MIHLRQDLAANPADVAITLNGLSHVVTPDLARDLSQEVIAMLNHSRPHIRKRAILTLYKLCDKYPGALPHGVVRLQERLDDSDPGKSSPCGTRASAFLTVTPGVVSAAVNVLCELARRNPLDYLSLAPHLFHLLTTSSNNWMLIKLVKLVGYPTWFVSAHINREV